MNDANEKTGAEATNVTKDERAPDAAASTGSEVSDAELEGVGRRPEASPRELEADAPVGVRGRQRGARADDRRDAIEERTTQDLPELDRARADRDAPLA